MKEKFYKKFDMIIEDCWGPWKEYYHHDFSFTRRGGNIVA